MKRISLVIAACWLAGGVGSNALAQIRGPASTTAGGMGNASVVNSPHNLSSGGPGAVRAATESQVCIFCHTPHNSAFVRPLWNRTMSPEAYTIYTSKSLDAKPGQPTGTSKLCLSCHDGTIALGSVVSRSTPIQIAGGLTTIPPGHSNLGTDLSDDHPISFKFDSSLISKNTKLKDPANLPPQIRLDGGGELQCTACHDAHNDSLGNFLVMRNDTSQLCISCHQVGKTSVAGHSNCDDCHQSHTAPSGPYLLRKKTIADTCLMCHDGTLAASAEAANVASDFKKYSVHETFSPVDPSGAPEEHVSCADCHEPHTMARGSGERLGAPTVHSNFGRVSGVNASGAPVKVASFEFEVCFKCHSDTASQKTTGRKHLTRRIAQYNTRLQFSPAAISFHPIEAPGKNMDVPSLLPGWTVGSIMYCSSCHASDSGKNTVNARPGPVHGSNVSPLLNARYQTGDFTTESSAAYAMCYQCHDRGSILEDRSFTAHKLHIVDQRTSCSACHDSHGISSTQGSMSGNSNLINFDSSVVFPDKITGRLEFRDTGRFSGECFLSCHGVNHSPLKYPAAATMPSPSRSPSASPAPRPPGFPAPTPRPSRPPK